MTSSKFGAGVSGLAFDATRRHACGVLEIRIASLETIKESQRIR
jgi:hypothetical protein